MKFLHGLCLKTYFSAFTGIKNPNLSVLDAWNCYFINTIFMEHFDQFLYEFSHWFLNKWDKHLNYAKLFIHSLCTISCGFFWLIKFPFKKHLFFRNYVTASCSVHINQSKLKSLQCRCYYDKCKHVLTQINTLQTAETLWHFIHIFLNVPFFFEELSIILKYKPLMLPKWHFGKQ